MRFAVDGVRALALVAALFGLGCNAETITQKLRIGDACEAFADCGTQPQFYCETGAPGGYCSKDCRTDADCPAESICAFKESPVGRCRKKCNITSDCRQGYVCRFAANAMDTQASHPFCEALPDGDGGTTVDMSRPSDGAPAGG